MSGSGTKYCQPTAVGHRGLTCSFEKSRMNHHSRVHTSLAGHVAAMWLTPFRSSLWLLALMSVGFSPSPFEATGQTVLSPAAAPNQPTFYSVPTPAKIYPYTYSNSPDDVNGPYLVTVDCTDPDGAADLQHAYLQLTGSGTAQTLMYFNLTTVQQWSGEGNHLYNFSASKSAITNGYRVTWSFQIKSTWTPSTNVDFEAWSLDKGNLGSTHRTNDWNGIYDNNLVIADARKTTLVDNDGDGWYSSVRIEADANTSVASRTIRMIAYRRVSAAGDGGGTIGNTGDYTTSGGGVDWRGITATVPSKAVYDFAWELYDPTRYITNRWYDVDGDISNIQMEPAGEDVANAPPSQPAFYDVPSLAKLYPYTYPNSPDDINGPYVVTVDYTDPNGASDLQHVYLQLTGSGTAQTLMYFNLTIVQQWAGEGDHLYNFSATKSAITNGYRVTWSFQMKSTWTPSTNVDFEAWSLDKGNLGSTHRTNDWNGIYDNNLVIADARKTTLVDDDGDGWYSSVRIEADANTSVSSRTVRMIAYRRVSAVGDGGGTIGNTGDYTTSSAGVDWQGITATVPSKAIYDFAWELYDPTRYITNRWYDVDADISNLGMELPEQDKPHTVNGTLDFPCAGALIWNKIDWGWQNGLAARNITQGGSLVLSVEPTTGIGSQVENAGHGFGFYSAMIKSAPATLAPEGVCHGFFYYGRSDLEEIDVEILTAKPGYVYFIVQGGEKFRVAVPDQATQFHEYGFEWTSTSVKFYLDGQPAVGDRVNPGGTMAPDIVQQTNVQAIAYTNVPQVSGTLIINNWCGNDWAGYPPSSLKQVSVQDVVWPTRGDAGDVVLASPSNGATNVVQPVGLDWSDVPGVSGYQVQVDDNANFSSPAIDQSPVPSSYSASGLLPGTLYHWRVRANSSCGYGNWTSPWTFTTACPTPGTPSLASPSNGATNVAQPVGLDWSVVAGVSGYQVQVDDNADFSSPAIDQSPVPSSYSASGLLPGTLYHWRVRANSSCGYGNWTSPWTFSTACPPPSSAPTSVASSDDQCNQICVSWQWFGSDQTGFKVYRDGAPTHTGTNPNERSWCDPITGTHSYYVVAYNACGNGPPSNTDPGTGLTPPTATPGSVSASDNRCNEICVSWSWSGSGQSGFKVYRDGSPVHTGTDPNERSWCDPITGTHSYYVVAYNTCGDGPPSNTDPGTGLTAPTSAPTSVAGTDNLCDTIRVSWQWSGSGQAGFKVFRDGSGSPTATLADPGQRSWWELITGPHTYTVVAYNACGDGPPSNTDPGTGLAKPASAPTSVAASDNLCDTIRVSWSWSGSGQAGFQVFRDGSGSPVYTGAVPGERSWWELITGPHTYTVVAYNACGDGPTSSPPDQGTGLTPPTSAPASVAASDNLCDTIRVSWQWSGSGQTGFKVFRDGSLTPIYTGTVPSERTWWELITGPHTYTVKAYNACGDGPPSNTDPGTGLTAPTSAPTAVNLEGNVPIDSQYCIRWNRVSGALQYEIREDAGSWSTVGSDTQMCYRKPVPDSFSYVVRALNTCGAGPASDTVWVKVTPGTDVGDVPSSTRPHTYALSQNYPNPFNSGTEIRFALPASGRVILTVYDVLGREITRLVDQDLEPGVKGVSWDGTDANGRSVPSGVYFYRLTAGRYTESKKMVLLK